ncbi:MAG TPA: Flp pilus assembly protein CpaB [Candidatus Acidoferrales bacterium]|nr:Flp pilus assembly protein CpaB [Candidatus Acidoferrales bacterium]
MNRNRLIIGVAGALVVALLASAFVYRQYKLQAPKAAVAQYIVVANEPLQVGTRVDSMNLKLIAWPAEKPVAGMFARIEDCAGRALITPVVMNEPILDSKLAPRQAGAGLPATIPEGMRALSVAVNDVVGVAGFVIPGTMVDVLVTGTLPSAKGSDSNITRTILEDVRVLAAGQKIEQDKDGKPINVPVVTLLVTPEDAVKLAMASTEGKIQLALRNTIDTKITAPEPVLQAVLFEGVAQPQAPRRIVKGKPVPPPPPYQIEIISGDKHTTKSFPNEGQF